MEGKEGPGSTRVRGTSAPAAAGAAPAKPAGASTSTMGSGVETASAAFKSGLPAMNELIDALVTSVDVERAELAAQRTQLEADREAFTAETSRVQAVLNDAQPVRGAGFLPAFPHAHGTSCCAHLAPASCPHLPIQHTRRSSSTWAAPTSPPPSRHCATVTVSSRPCSGACAGGCARTQALCGTTTGYERAFRRVCAHARSHACSQTRTCSGRHEVCKAADGSVFIDRDGRHFPTVLNFLRDGQLAYPPDGTDYKVRPQGAHHSAHTLPACTACLCNACQTAPTARMRTRKTGCTHRVRAACTACLPALPARWYRLPGCARAL
jgi:hypothetical protein